MDLERFQALVRQPRHTKDDLVQMLENARQKGAIDHAAIVKDTLDARFPTWEARKAKKGGATPTRCVFGEKEQTFASAKEAYLWLVEQFIKARPSVFNAPSREETLYVALGTKRMHFARSPQAIFKANPDLADKGSNFSRLSNGWYADVNLSNPQKFEILVKFGRIAGKRFGVDWNFNVLDPNEAILDRQKVVAAAEKAVESLLAEFNLS